MSSAASNSNTRHDALRLLGRRVRFEMRLGAEFCSFFSPGHSRAQIFRCQRTRRAFKVCRAPWLPYAAHSPFVGNEIPLDGEAVAELCIQRLTLEAEVDDG